MALTSKLYLQTLYALGRTFLEKSFCTPPFKLADITLRPGEEELHLMIMSSSPGVLEGDQLEMNISLGERSSVRLETQSYQRLFRMQSGATQAVKITLGKAARLVYLPHPVVPHEQADFTTACKIFLQNDSILIWGEILTCGRNLNGEIFRFTKYHSITEIYVDYKKIVRENLLLTPFLVNMFSMGQWEGFTHQASLFFIHEKINVAEVKQALINYQQMEDISFGCTSLSGSGMLIRMLGHKAEILHQHLKDIAEKLLQIYPQKNPVYDR
jgi:urease accessory protein